MVIELLCEIGGNKRIADRFDKKEKMEEVDDMPFWVIVTVCSSLTFYRGVFGWNGRMTIVGSEPTKQEYKTMLLKSLKAIS